MTNIPKDDSFLDGDELLRMSILPDDVDKEDVFTTIELSCNQGALVLRQGDDVIAMSPKQIEALKKIFKL